MTQNAPGMFAMTGVAGYVAPRHLRAIKDTGNLLVAAMDPHDSVGVLDRYFPGVAYFREFERFDRHLEKLRRPSAGGRVQWVSICSPNFLHDAHIRLALRVGANAICEKPLVLNPWNLDALEELEAETGRRVFTILQLRVHPALLALRESLRSGPPDRMHQVSLTYVTSRGPWYRYSWKGSLEKSGGLATNIGIHFFDLLLWFFGGVRGSAVLFSNENKTSGVLELERAHVEWALSIDREDLPEGAVTAGKSTYRSMRVDGQEVEFSDGFTDLHTRVYEETLAGRGFGLADARPAIELAYRLRTARPEYADQSSYRAIPAVERQ